jgi:hypothetical protein
MLFFILKIAALSRMHPVLGFHFYSHAVSEKAIAERTASQDAGKTSSCALMLKRLQPKRRNYFHR